MIFVLCEKQWEVWQRDWVGLDLAVPQPALQRFNILSSGLWWDLIQGSGLN